MAFMPLAIRRLNHCNFKDIFVSLAYLDFSTVEKEWERESNGDEYEKVYGKCIYVRLTDKCKYQMEGLNVC